jgi:hypothetical protein
VLEVRAERRRKPISLEAETLLTEGKLSEAVKVVREAEGLSAKEARRRVDAHIADDPMLGVQLETRRRDLRRRTIHVLLLAVVLILAAVIYARYFAPN